MSKEADIFREGLRQYFADLTRVNSEALARYTEKNAELVKLGMFPLTTQLPAQIPPSLNDIWYWATKSGHYAEPKESA